MEGGEGMEGKEEDEELWTGKGEGYGTGEEGKEGEAGRSALLSLITTTPLKILATPLLLDYNHSL